MLTEPPPMLVGSINKYLCDHDIVPMNEAEMKCQTAKKHDSKTDSDSSCLTEAESGASSDFKFFPDLKYESIPPAIPCAPFSPVYKSSNPKVRGSNRSGPELTCSICHMVCPRIYELERYPYFSYLL
jgi:hypothetical protein